MQNHSLNPPKTITFALPIKPLMNHRFIAVFLLAFSVFCFGKNSIPSHLLEKVSIDSLKKYEYKLASREFGGRLVNTGNGWMSSNYIMECFKNNGLIPVLAKGTSYSQRFHFDLNQLQANKAEKVNSEGSWAQNIIGVIPGRDKNSGHIVITAHHDHMGVIDNEIHYGADDNGSGVSALIEISRIISVASRKGFKPRRTIVFISTDAEEKRLLGSEYYMKNPVFPVKKMICTVNFDMIGRIDSAHSTSKDLNNYIYCIYKDTTQKVFSKSYFNRINASTPGLLLDDKYESHVNNTAQYSFITRSDHYSFMKEGIPFVWFFSGFHADYHQPSDTPDKICYPELRKRVQYMLALIWDLANKQ